MIIKKNEYQIIDIKGKCSSLHTKEQMYVTLNLFHLKPLCSERTMVAASSARQILTFCHSSLHKMYPMTSDDDDVGSRLSWRQDSTLDLWSESETHHTCKTTVVSIFYSKIVYNRFLKWIKEPQTIKDIIEVEKKSKQPSWNDNWFVAASPRTTSWLIQLYWGGPVGKKKKKKLK